MATLKELKRLLRTKKVGAVLVQMGCIRMTTSKSRLLDDIKHEPYSSDPYFDNVVVRFVWLGEPYLAAGRDGMKRDLLITHIGET